MVQVGVGQNDSVNRPGIERKWRPIPQPELLEPLEEPAVDEHPVPLEFEKVLGPGDRLSRTKESERSDVEAHIVIRSLNEGALPDYLLPDKSSPSGRTSGPTR